MQKIINVNTNRYLASAIGRTWLMMLAMVGGSSSDGASSSSANVCHDPKPRPMTRGPAL